MMTLNVYLSILTLNVNGLNDPIKRHRVSDWMKKQDPTICCLQETHFIFIFLKDWLIDWLIDFLIDDGQREREREAETQEEREAGSRPGAGCGTQSRESRITPWAKGRCQTAEPPRDPWDSFEGNTYSPKMKGWRTVYHSNGPQKKAGVAILISDKLKFIPKTVVGDEEGHYIILSNKKT